MTTPEVFRDSQHALERGQWKERQSKRIFETAQETIAQSKRLMELARNLKPIYRSAEK